MSDHLSAATLNALADGELKEEELASVTEHLHGCPACTSNALQQSLLKSATERAGQRYEVPDELRRRMERIASSQNAPGRMVERRRSSLLSPSDGPAKWAGWAAAAALLLSAGGMAVFEVNERRVQTAAVQRKALATELSDQHIATLAVNLPPQVLSSDRHTVKPWFQGKIPFSFNLPDNLPEGTKLEGANLVYLHNRPAAQLLYSIGSHRVSVFVQQRTTGAEEHAPAAEQEGFRLSSFNTRELDVVAISDVDPASLANLIGLIERAQVR
jgi:anti-sigma factor RsiW